MDRTTLQSNSLIYSHAQKGLSYSVSGVFGHVSECVSALIVLINNTALNTLRTLGHSVKHFGKSFSRRRPEKRRRWGNDAMTISHCESFVFRPWVTIFSEIALSGFAAFGVLAEVLTRDHLVL